MRKYSIEASVENNTVSLVTHFPSNRELWAEAREALILIRDEINRQIDNELKCPFNPKFTK